MKRIKIFILNVSILTTAALVMRSIGVGFNVYLSGKLGADGMGLFTLLMTVYNLGVTFAVSGVSLASTRMTAEVLGGNNRSLVIPVMRRCLIYSICFGTAAWLILLAGAPFIGIHLLADERAVHPLRILSFGLPAIAVSTAIGGYFNAVRRAYKSASTQLIEQLSRIAVTFLIFSHFMPTGLEAACITVVVGSVIGEVVSLLYCLSLYLFDIRKTALQMSTLSPEPISEHENESKKGHPFLEKIASRFSPMTAKLLNTALPVAISTYIRSGLLTVEHLLIPWGLRQSGSSSQRSLEMYGVLHGMALPIVLFPMAFLSAFAGMLVPELAEAQARRSDKRIHYIISRVFQATLLFSIGCAGIMICFSGEIGMAVYGSQEAAEYIRMTAPLIPVMYLDHVVDGMLKGLGEQLYSMRVNIADSILSVLLVILLLPRFGVEGYIAVVFICEIFNAALSIGRLLTISPIKPHLIRWLVFPLFSVIGAASGTQLMAGLTPYMPSTHTGTFLLYGITATILYLILLRCTQSLNREDICWLKSIVKKN